MNNFRMLNFQEGANGGSVQGYLTGTTVTWPKTPDGSAKRKAMQELEAAEKEIEVAAIERARALGITRPLTQTEIKNGSFVPKDMRSLSEKKAAGVPTGVEFRTPTPPDPNKNPFLEHLEHLKAQVKQMRPRQAQETWLKIARYEQLTTEWQTKRDAENATQAALDATEVQTCVSTAKAWFALLQGKTDIPQQWLNTIRKNLEDVEKTGNTADFWARHDAVLAERDKLLDERAAALALTQEELKTEKAVLRSARSEKPQIAQVESDDSDLSDDE